MIPKVLFYLHDAIHKRCLSVRLSICHVPVLCLNGWTSMKSFHRLTAPTSCLSVRSTRQLKRSSDPNYFLPLSVRYSVIADGHGSCRSWLFLTCDIPTRPTDYAQHAVSLCSCRSVTRVISDRGTSLLSPVHTVEGYLSGADVRLFVCRSVCLSPTEISVYKNRR